MPVSRSETEEKITQRQPTPHTGGPRGPRNRNPDERRWGGGDPDPGSHGSPSVAAFGMRLMLISITILFVVLASAYLSLARTHPNWRAIYLPNALWVSTVLIITSSWTLERARHAIQRGDLDQYARWLLRTVLLGVTFLISQVVALRQFVVHGLPLPDNPHSSLFYIITGTHAVHLLGGLAALNFILIRTAMRRPQSAAAIQRQRSLTSVIALYWHFLDALWISVLMMLLLWR